MPEWMTSLLRDEVSEPIPSAASRTITERPVAASARAIASPMTPAPITIASISLIAAPGTGRSLPGSHTYHRSPRHAKAQFVAAKGAQCFARRRDGLDDSGFFTEGSRFSCAMFPRAARRRRSVFSTRCSRASPAMAASMSPETVADRRRRRDRRAGGPAVSGSRGADRDARLSAARSTAASSGPWRRTPTPSSAMSRRRRWSSSTTTCSCSNCFMARRSRSRISRCNGLGG